MSGTEGRRRAPAFWADGVRSFYERPIDMVRSFYERPIDMVRSFYERPIAWAALLVSAAFLTYGGGAVMFWFHAVVRGEAGPSIGYVHHWLLDSTLGFVALTPVLGVILPLAVWHAGARPWVYVAAVAVLFTLVTGPGPLLHDKVAGAGTPLAELATDVFGEKPMAMSHDHGHNSPFTEGALQLVVGLPVYLTSTWLALGFVRLSVRASRRRRNRIATLR